MSLLVFSVYLLRVE